MTLIVTKYNKCLMYISLEPQAQISLSEPHYSWCWCVKGHNQLKRIKEKACQGLCSISLLWAPSPCVVPDLTPVLFMLEEWCVCVCVCVLPFRLQNDRMVKCQGKTLLFFIIRAQMLFFLLLPSLLQMRIYQRLNPSLLWEKQSLLERKM